MVGEKSCIPELSAKIKGRSAFQEDRDMQKHTVMPPGQPAQAQSRPERSPDGIHRLGHTLHVPGSLLIRWTYGNLFALNFKNDNINQLSARSGHMPDASQL